MSEDKKSTQKAGPKRFVSVLVMITRFEVPIQVFVFIILASILMRWLATPVAHAIAALLVVLPFYWLKPRRKIGFPAYVAFCIVLAACLTIIEHFLIS